MRNTKSDYIRLIRHKFAEAEKAKDTLDYKTVDSYLEEIEKLAETDTGWDPVATAMVQSEQAAAEAFRDRLAQSGLEAFRSVVSTSIEAYKASLLINGGAAVALLALIGHGAATTGFAVGVGLARALGSFVAGVLCAAVTAGAAYLAQNGYGFATADPELNAKAKRQGDRWRNLAIALMLLSYALFVAGSVCAYVVFAAGSPACF